MRFTRRASLPPLPPRLGHPLLPQLAHGLLVSRAMRLCVPWPPCVAGWVLVLQTTSTGSRRRRRRGSCARCVPSWRRWRRSCTRRAWTCCSARRHRWRLPSLSLVAWNEWLARGACVRASASRTDIGYACACTWGQAGASRAAAARLRGHASSAGPAGERRHAPRVVAIIASPLCLLPTRPPAAPISSSYASSSVVMPGARSSPVRCPHGLTPTSLSLSLSLCVCGPRLSVDVSAEADGRGDAGGGGGRAGLRACTRPRGRHGALDHGALDQVNWVN
jgi:hypothetical protein